MSDEPKKKPATKKAKPKMEESKTEEKLLIDLWLCALLKVLCI